ncbi:thioredoxin-disulfide reductase [Anaerobranca gottschalkii]|uniref:Thioredoxin reductase n=1 Tax=Anaerobranca gottschalkii DSM 13577 TaxID=1120990 RepID=A0A1I0CFF8_9FIRM|nr:thioredoxin-disulfide reductase [Anaerobranca gottschalkii]SET17674.1 thioredoxin reductase (NADPH) [Anaerobranca gottschalkii DSM 13577]
MVYDIIIIGGGPGGLTAAIYGARSKLKTLVIEKGKIGGQAATTEEMENYPGFFNGTTGPALTKRMEEHAKFFGAEFVKDEVKEIINDGFIKKISTRNGEYQAKAVIIATGAEPRVLGVKGEGALRGKGVSYCATCDADFFEDLDVVVVGNGDAAIEEAIYLTKFANKVSIIVIHDEGILDATPVIQERAYLNPKIEFIWNSVLEEIVGDGIVEGVKIKNLKTGEITDLEVNGVFIFVGTVPKTDFLKGVVELDPRGYILTNDLMETSVEGIYAVGDVRQKFLRQVVTACADGAIAAVAAEKYIHEEEMFREQVLEEEKPVSVLFWTPSSDECIQLVSEVERNFNKEKSKLVKVDTYRNLRIKNRYNVDNVPALLLFHNGQQVKRLENPEEILQFAKKIDL